MLPATSATLLIILIVLVGQSVGGHNADVFEVMRQTGLNMINARLAIAVAETTNAKGVIVLKEALDTAQAFKAAEVTDPPEAFIVKRIRCVANDQTIATTIEPARPNITIQLTVSAKNGFHAYKLQRTDSEGQTSFQWPSDEPVGVNGKVSVTALLSGLTADSLFVWGNEAKPWEFDNSSK